jgi:hypothetical protein
MSEFKKIMMEVSKRGYVSLPLDLIGKWLDETRKLTEFEAFILMLGLVNFKDNEVETPGGRAICRRGESIRSVEHWSSKFRWNMAETRAFLEALREMGMLERIGNPINENHIRIAEYEWLTGKATGNAQTEKVEKRTLFDDFWEIYHTVTGMIPSEKMRARLAWNRLSDALQDKAIEGIKNYYDALTLKKYCRKAATYLENRSFE